VPVLAFYAIRLEMLALTVALCLVACACLSIALPEGSYTASCKNCQILEAPPYQRLSCQWCVVFADLVPTLAIKKVLTNQKATPENTCWYLPLYPCRAMG